MVGGKKMSIVYDIRRLARQVIGPVLVVSLMVYVIYHGVQGNHGLIAYWQLVKQVDTAKQALAVLDEEKLRLQRRVKLLHPDSLDPDMLEERARVMLGYAHPLDEIIVDRPDRRPR